MTTNTTYEVAVKWLNIFRDTLEAGNIDGIAACFLPHGWLRDILTFTWNNRSLEGRKKISDYLRPTLAAANISDIELEERQGLSPQFGPISSSVNCISSGFRFTTNVAIGQGYFHLVKDESGQWKALSVFMAVADLKGHEENDHEQGVYGGHTLAWTDVDMNRRRNVEENPHVLIIGGGQTGLNVAARFRQMNIPSILIEANARIGDNWRKRYPTLSLHTPRTHHPMLYQPFPKNWPIFTPRDKVADWLEQYAQSQDLIVWTKSQPLPHPKYDFATRRWSVTIDRDGTLVELNPAHIVLATGTLGEPHVPKIPYADAFRGVTLHASKYNGGHPFTGKRVVVLGAGNTSADICQDLSFHGAEVTMVQRSSTCVVSSSITSEAVLQVWPENTPTEVADFKYASRPLLLNKRLSSEDSELALAREKTLHDGLTKAGLKVNMGSDGSGFLPMLYERFGGYWIDVGCAERIISGQIKIKQGVEIERFIEDGVVFTDGSTLPADVVIFATGYNSIRDVMKKTFGEETIGKTAPVWGLDEEGELRGCYRPTGHPGLWYGAGDFYNSRFSSKQLALEIKAIELGLMQV